MNRDEETALEEKLKKSIEELESMFLARKHLENLKKEINQKRSRIGYLKLKVEEEYRDIEVLESLSIKSIFSKTLGNLSEQLEVERQEYLQAVLNYKEVNKSLEYLEYEENILNKKIKKIDEKENEIEDLLKIREETIIVNYIGVQIQLRTINTRLDDCRRKRIDIKEAIATGMKCNQDLGSIIVKMKVASKLMGWGFTNANTSSNKETIMDEPVTEYYKFKVCLLKFANELKSVFNSNIDIVGRSLIQFDKFIDVYYNYLINDWIIRNQISNTISMMSALQDEIISYLKNLYKMEEKVDREIDFSIKSKRDLIFNDILK